MTDHPDTAPARLVVHADPELRDLIPGYLEHRRQDVTTMRDALERGDWETIRLLAHTMKGSGGGYGFDAITEIGGCLERAARDRDAAGVGAGLRELAAYLDRVEPVYE